jgi:hypothetical protein
MPRFVDSLSILAESREAEHAWRILSELFKAHQMTLAPGTCVIFNDHENLEREPEEVHSEGEALTHIINWPSLGGVEYGLAGHKVIVFTFGKGAHQVDVITVSTMVTPYMTRPKFKSRFDALVVDVHRALNASRTICDYEVLSPNSVWAEELARVRNGRFEGSYSVDLR